MCAPLSVLRELGDIVREREREESKRAGEADIFTPLISITNWRNSNPILSRITLCCGILTFKHINPYFVIAFSRKLSAWQRQNSRNNTVKAISLLRFAEFIPSFREHFQLMLTLCAIWCALATHGASHSSSSAFRAMFPYSIFHLFHFLCVVCVAYLSNAVGDCTHTHTYADTRCFLCLHSWHSIRHAFHTMVYEDRKVICAGDQICFSVHIHAARHTHERRRWFFSHCQANAVCFFFHNFSMSLCVRMSVHSSHPQPSLPRSYFIEEIEYTKLPPIIHIESPRIASYRLVFI